MVGRLVERPLCRALVAALIVATAACGDEPSIALTEWTLVDPSGTHEIRLPTHVDDLLASRGERYRLTSTVQLPERLRGQPLTLAIPRLPAPVELRANGVLIEPAESTLFVGYRSPGAHRWRLPGALTAGERLDLELAVADTWFQSSWIGSIARLSTHPDGDRWYRFVSTFNVAANGLATALVGMIGFIYLLVYLGDRRQVAYGWFAAQALSAAAYPLFMLGPTQWLLGTNDLRLLPLVAIAAIVSVGYTHTHFQLPPASRWWLVGGFATVLSAFFVRGPYSAAWGMWPTVAAVAVAATYQIQLCIRLLLRGVKQGNAATQLVAWIVLALAAGLDLTYWLGFGAWHHGFQGAAVGLTIFALLQTMALSREHLRAMREASALNEELRRQVSARSRQLSHALARLGRSSAKPVTPAEGTVIDDRYRVVRKLGEGAMATVFQVVRLEDGRELALKQLKASSDARILARFAREAHIASEVSHPNLVSIHDIDFASDGFMYIVMDLVSGGAVSDHRERFGDLPWALEILRQTARGLAALHDSGVVHRDLKPANILLQEGDSVVAKISDFGVSGMLDDTGADLLRLDHSQSDGPTPTAVTRADIGSSSETLDTESIDIMALERRAALDTPRLTQVGHLLGTPAYMAPELHEGVDSAPVRDVFSFGVLAFELLTGERPYSTPPLLCRLRRQTTDEARQLADACPALNPELARHLQAAVSLVPDERPTLEILVAAFDNA